MGDLRALIEAVEADRVCTIPSPKAEGVTARIMGYVEGYVVMRHKGAIPFLVHKKDLIAMMKGE